MTNPERIEAAIAIAERYGGIDGEHHKQWVIDQMLRVLMTPERYEEFWRTRTNGPDGEPDYYMPWDTGIAP